MEANIIKKNSLRKNNRRDIEDKITIVGKEVQNDDYWRKNRRYGTQIKKLRDHTIDMI